MGTTTQFGLPYPELTDPPDGPGAVKALAQATALLLSRCLVCTSTTRPTGVGQGFMIFETDTKLIMMYDGSSWFIVCQAAGGGTYARYRNSGSNSYPGGASSNLSFPTTADPGALVTRTADGTGHKFTLGRAGVWQIGLNGRFSLSGSAAMYLGSTSTSIMAGKGMVNQASDQLVVCRRFALNEVITPQITTQSGGSAATYNVFSDDNAITFAWLSP